MTGGAAQTPSQAPSVDGFLGGLVTLVQPRAGHRAGLDAALLQALVPAAASGHAVDLGAGVGTVGFAVAARAPALSVTGVEQSQELIACAQSALRLPDNAAFAGRVRLVRADVTEAVRTGSSPWLAEHSADWVLTNPPYDEPRRVRPSPDAARRAAHVGEPGALAAWLKAAARLLKPGGCLGLIHRAAALPDVLLALAGPFGDICILPIHPFAESAAGRIVVRARHGSRAPVQIRPGLVLHDPGGSWTAEADAILRDRAELPIC